MSTTVSSKNCSAPERELLFALLDQVGEASGKQLARVFPIISLARDTKIFSPAPLIRDICDRGHPERRWSPAPCDEVFKNA
jgi:hypothetical protein